MIGRTFSGTCRQRRALDSEGEVTARRSFP